MQPVLPMQSPPAQLPAQQQLPPMQPVPHPQAAGQTSGLAGSLRARLAAGQATGQGAAEAAMDGEQDLHGFSVPQQACPITPEAAREALLTGFRLDAPRGCLTDQAFIDRTAKLRTVGVINDVIALTNRTQEMEGKPKSEKIALLFAILKEGGLTAQ
eukprot:15469996-Alexandrium_andersonii.AAC.2